MADLSGLPDDIVYVLRTGKLPPGVALPDTDDEPEDPDAEVFRARYHLLVEERISEWLVSEQERAAGSLSDFGDRTVPAAVREQIEQDCHRRIQQEWRTFLHQRDHPDDGDADGGPVSWMQSVR